MGRLFSCRCLEAFGGSPKVWYNFSMFLECMSFLASFFLGVSYVDTHRFTRSHYKVESEKVKKNFRMVVLSDLHGNVYGKENDPLIEAVKREKPDVVLIPGDLITGVGAFEVPPMLALVKKVSAICPVYMSMGNHESKVKWIPKRFRYSYEELMGMLRKAGAQVLDNDALFLKEMNMEVKGLSLPSPYFRRDMMVSLQIPKLEEYVGKVKKDRFTLLLAHNPEYFDAYAEYGADLTVSGHLHGGIMQLPKLGGIISPRYILLPPYASGLFEKNDKKMLVSRGLGSHTIPLRIFNPGDLMVIDVRRK